MVVYFSQYILFYSFIAAPLFALLRKGSKWSWNVEHEIAFQPAKDTLAATPVLGHPEQGYPYRVYSDALDYAIGASLQQVQPLLVQDLKGTPVYHQLCKAYEPGQDIPQLFSKVTKDVEERR